MKSVSTEKIVTDLFWTQYLSIILIIIVTIVAAFFGKVDHPSVLKDPKIASVPLGEIFINDSFLPSGLDGSVEILSSHDVKGVFYIGSSDVTSGAAHARILKGYFSSRGIPENAVEVFFSTTQKSGSAHVIFERELAS